jgi:hypothetical protein
MACFSLVASAWMSTMTTSAGLDRMIEIDSSGRQRHGVSNESMTVRPHQNHWPALRNTVKILPIWETSLRPTGLYPSPAEQNLPVCQTSTRLSDGLYQLPD